MKKKKLEKEIKKLRRKVKEDFNGLKRFKSLVAVSLLCLHPKGSELKKGWESSPCLNLTPRETFELYDYLTKVAYDVDLEYGIDVIRQKGVNALQKYMEENKICSNPKVKQYVKGLVRR